MKAYFAVIRWANLLYLLLTLCTLRFLLIDPLFEMAGYTPSLGTVLFLLLVLSIMLIAAAGYIINDYFDVETDRINKPHKVYIGTTISPDMAMRFYYICSALGILIGTYLAWEVGNIRLVSVHLLSAALLWFYAISLKGKPFIGNLVISALVALSVLSVALFDAELLAFMSIKTKEVFKSVFETVTGFLVAAPELNSYTNRELFETILTYVGAYAGFAFLLNLVREMVKDIEDIEGDEEAGLRTLPIAAGVPFTKLLAVGFTLITVNFIAKFQINQFLVGQTWVAIFTLLLVQVPLLYITYKLFKASVKKDFTHISKVIKLVMLMGLAYFPYLRASMQFIPAQTILPPGIESITYDADTTEIEQPDTLKYIIDTKEGITRPDTASTPQTPNKSTQKVIDDDLLK